MCLEKKIGAGVGLNDAGSVAVCAKFWRPFASLWRPLNETTSLFIPSPEKVFKIIRAFCTGGCLHILSVSNAGDVISISRINPDRIPPIDE